MRGYRRGDTRRALARGARMRCPACGLGRLFAGRWTMQRTCPYCRVRFERADGESLGAAVLNTGLTVTLGLVGFFLTTSRSVLPDALELALWVAVSIAFSALAYRPMRGLWVAIAYITGGVYPDPDYEREYYAREQRTTAKAPTGDG